jgi:glycosyltransferase involved in cell wall biosynthesis
MGSEPEAGLQAVLAAASKHEVWVIARQYHIPFLESYFEHHPLSDRIQLIGFDLDGWSRRMESRLGLAGVHWHHDRWQRRLAEIATELDTKIDFDLVHHATYAAYWTRTGVAEVDKPLVWGPIGGAVTTPLRLLATMGLRGAVGDLLRSVARPVVAALVKAKRTGRKAAVAIVQNPETARKIGRAGDATVLPNALAAADSLPPGIGPTSHASDKLRLITAGRLVGWKGTLLAIDAMRHVADPNAVLEVYGEGPQQSRLEKHTSAQGLDHRVDFKGQVTRDELLRAMADAAALVHPSFHEEAGFVVSEALALGTPVVCLNRGGPPVLTRAWPNVPSRAVEPGSRKATAHRIGAALNEVAGRRGRAASGPTPSFKEGLLAAYAQAAGRHAT